VTVATLALTPDELLTTTRAVRRRLDMERAVEPQLLTECVRIAQQAPNGSGKEGWHFLIVTDPARRAALAELYRLGGEEYLASPRAPSNPQLLRSASHLVTHLADVPVHVIPCMEGRLQAPSTAQMSGFWGTIAPAVWSFMLAARARGLGTAWTTFHLTREREAAELLGIPYERVTQAALLPVAHTLGSEFAAAKRAPLEQILHWDTWNEGGQ
jgi:nitroreductase